MKKYSKALFTSMAAVMFVGMSLSSYADGTAKESKKESSGPICSEMRSPYRDFDFLIGNWEFFTLKGQKIADQVYSKREQGCLILEDWSMLSGSTGTGMNFVDPASGKWRQVWMSPLFHIDYSGGLTENGDFVLEGRIYPNNGKPASAVRGVYSKQKDGSVTKEFLMYDEKSKVWNRFFIGVARRKK